MTDRDIAPEKLAKIRVAIIDEIFGHTPRVELAVGLSGLPHPIPRATLTVSGGDMAACQSVGLRLLQIAQDILASEAPSNG